MYTTEHEYEHGDKLYTLKLEIDYNAYEEEKRTYDDPGCPAYIDVQSIDIKSIKDEDGNIIKLSEEVLNLINKDLFKIEWDVIISEHLADEDDFYKSEYYDRKRDELLGY